MKIVVQSELSFESADLCHKLLREQARRIAQVKYDAGHRLEWIAANAIETLVTQIQTEVPGRPFWREFFDEEPQVLCDKLRERARRITQSSAAVDRLEWKAANVIETLILQLPEKQRVRS